MIEARGLSRSFAGRPAIEDVSFQVPTGRLCALLGPNGAGKTTTIRILLGLLAPSAGQAEVNGIVVPCSEASGARLRGEIGLLTEAPGFYDRMNGWENLELFGRLYGIAGPELRRRIEHWLRRLGLWEARDRPFGTWSKGMKQRLALIRAVLHEPPVLLLDEPTAGLDPAVAREVRDLIAGFRREGRTILLCTHNLVEAEELADFIGILQRRMLAFGAPQELVAAGPSVAVRLAATAESRAAIAQALRAFPAVQDCRVEGDHLRVSLEDPARDTPSLVRELVRLQADVLAIEPLRPSLEEVYLRAVRETSA